jgi:hypothetical protein
MANPQFLKLPGLSLSHGLTLQEALRVFLIKKGEGAECTDWGTVTHQQLVLYSSRTPFPHSFGGNRQAAVVCGFLAEVDVPAARANTAEDVTGLIMVVLEVIFMVSGGGLTASTEERIAVRAAFAPAGSAPAAAGVVVAGVPKAARHSLVQQKPQATHCSTFSGSSSGEPAASAGGQPLHPVAPMPEESPATHATHAVAPSSAAYVPAGQSEHGDHPPRPPPGPSAPPSGSARP